MNDDVTRDNYKNCEYTVVILTFTEAFVVKCGEYFSLYIVEQ